MNGAAFVFEAEAGAYAEMTALTTVNLSIPIMKGRLALGTWQGIYLCEHRDHGGARSLVATLSGE